MNILNQSVTILYHDHLRLANDNFWQTNNYLGLANENIWLATAMAKDGH